MQLSQLELKSNLSPKWGTGHYYAQSQTGESFELLVAQATSESKTTLISWAHALERVAHPANVLFSDVHDGRLKVCRQTGIQPG